ncbi:unnamed protein product [Larinioides sclopetarius]|uniref:snRNA-activating protein complex subunit 1 n=1 Tax=Larinioides sclopetarius TaxID=280406 RepID=A0AAV1YZW1_9ARAC
MPGIKYIAAGFVPDAEKLLTEFAKENSPEFSVFTHFWKKHNFAGVFLGRSSAELQQFTHEIFQLTLKFLVTAELHHQIGAVYLLYALFRNQIVEPPTRIRIVLKQYEHFLELRRLAVKERYKALHYVISYLIEHGFDYVAHPTLVGPRNSKHNMEVEKKALQMACMLKDLKDHSMSLFESNSLEELQELNKAYTELTKNIPFNNNVFQDANDFNMEVHIKNLSRLVGADKSDSEANNQNEKERENIGDRRARLKSNAFASKAWFRQLNPTDEEEDEDNGRFTRSRAQRKSLSRKAKLSADSQDSKDDEESDEKVIKPKRRVRRLRVPKEKRRIGRPRKNQELEELLMEVDDIADDNPFRGIKKRGPVARSSYLDRYIEQPFKEPDAEMTVLSSTSEEEENIDEPEEITLSDEKNDEAEELEISDKNTDEPEELGIPDIKY